MSWSTLYLSESLKLKGFVEVLSYRRTLSGTCWSRFMMLHVLLLASPNMQVNRSTPSRMTHAIKMIGWTKCKKVKVISASKLSLRTLLLRIGSVVAGGLVPANYGSQEFLIIFFENIGTSTLKGSLGLPLIWCHMLPIRQLVIRRNRDALTCTTRRLAAQRRADASAYTGHVHMFVVVVRCREVCMSGGNAGHEAATCRRHQATVFRSRWGRGGSLYYTHWSLNF